MLGFIEETNGGYGTARVILHHAFRCFLGRTLSDQDAEPYGSAFVLIAATAGNGNHLLHERKGRLKLLKETAREKSGQ